MDLGLYCNEAGVFRRASLRWTKKENRHSWKGRAQIKRSVSSGLTLCAIEPQSERPKEGLIESSCFSIGWGLSNVEGEDVEEGRSPPLFTPFSPRSHAPNDAGLPVFELGFDLSQQDSRCTARRSR